MGFENEIAGSSPERMLLFILPVKKNQVNSYLILNLVSLQLQKKVNDIKHGVCSAL